MLWKSCENDVEKLWKKAYLFHNFFAKKKSSKALKNEQKISKKMLKKNR
jgi:hypothetical protein